MSELDDIFKEAAQSEKAVFQPEYFEQYKQQFSTKKKKKKGLFGFFFIGIMVIGSGVALMAYNNMDGESLSNELVQKNESGINNKNNLVDKINATSNKENINNDNIALISNTISEIQENNFTRNQNLSLNKKSIRNKKKYNSNLLNNKESNYSESINSEVEKVEAQENENSNKLLKENEVVNKQIDNSIKENSESKEILASLKEKEDKTNNLSSDKGTSKREYEEEKDSLEKEEPVLIPEKKTSVVTRNKAKLLQFNVQFGGIVYNDFSMKDKVNNLKYGLTAGIELEYLIKPTFTISLGVNGYHRESESLQLNFNFIDNGFGEVATQKTYTYTDLYFVEVPVNLNYYLSSRHKITGGPVFTRLITTKVNELEEVKEVINNSSSSNSFLYHYNTFELNNLGVNLNYQYSFNRVGLFVGYTQGINEFLNKKTFNAEGFNSLSKLNISIKYKL